MSLEEAPELQVRTQPDQWCVLDNVKPWPEKLAEAYVKFPSIDSNFNKCVLL
jgi:hypothetical protein